MKEIIANLIKQADHFDQIGKYQDADELTKIAQNIDDISRMLYGTPEERQYLNNLEPKRGLTDTADYIADAFGTPKNLSEQDKYNLKTKMDFQQFEEQTEKEIIELLRQVSNINLKYKTPSGEIIIGNGMANHIVETAKKLLAIKTDM